MALWLCLRFDQLPLQALHRSQLPAGENDNPRVIIEHEKVISMNDNAENLGVKIGLNSSTVLALSYNIKCMERRKDREDDALQKLCCWAYNISPKLYSFRQDCVLIEIGDSLKLFSGVDNLLNRIHTDLSNRAWRYRAGIARTPKAAWLLSYKNEIYQVDKSQHLKKRLTPLPLKLLSDFKTEVASLRKVGLYHFGDIFKLPYSSLGRRCGKSFVIRLKEILGEQEDGEKNFEPPDSFSDDYLFGYEVKNSTELLPACRILLQSLCQYLHVRQLKCNHLEWSFYDYSSKVEKLSIKSSQPHRDWETWQKLTNLKVSSMNLNCSIESISISSDKFSSDHTITNELFSEAVKQEPLHYLLDRLRSRLGKENIKKLIIRDENLPEIAGNCGADNGEKTSTKIHRRRPLWLMPEPQVIQWHRKNLYWNGCLKLLQGPERIEDNWWKKPVSRDYYLAENPKGDIIWIFLDRLRSRWFVHGIFTRLA